MRTILAATLLSVLVIGSAQAQQRIFGANPVYVQPVQIIRSQPQGLGSVLIPPRTSYSAQPSFRRSQPTQPLYAPRRQNWSPVIRSNCVVYGTCY